MGYTSSNPYDYPATVDGGVHLYPVICSDAATGANGIYAARGYVPGLYDPMEVGAGTERTTTTINGKTYLIVNVVSNTAAAVTTSRAYFDVTGPWR